MKTYTSLDEFYADYPEPHQESKEVQDMEVALLKADLLAALVNEQRERRQLFIATMRKPEMRLLRAALLDLKWEHGVDWETLTSLEIIPANEVNSTWILLTDHHESVCLWPEYTPIDFLVFRLHDANDPLCDCDDCQEDRICHIRLRGYYIAQQQQQPTNA